MMAPLPHAIPGFLRLWLLSFLHEPITAGVSLSSAYLSVHLKFKAQDNDIALIRLSPTL